MPIIDVTKPIVGLDGSPIIGRPSPDKEPEAMTVRSACIQALMGADEKDSGELKFKCFRLAQKINEEDKTHLDAGDVQLIKERSGKVFVPIVIGRLWDILDPPPPKVLCEPSRD